MEFYVISTISELGIDGKIDANFPNAEQMTFIEEIMNEKNTDVALQNKTEETNNFEKNGLNDAMAAIDFFRRLKIVCERGSYKNASIRMDIQMSTRVINNAPDCKFNMLLETTDFTEKLNMAPSTCDKLLSELKNAKKALQQNKILIKEQTE